MHNLTFSSGWLWQGPPYRLVLIRHVEHYGEDEKLRRVYEVRIPWLDVASFSDSEQNVAIQLYTRNPVVTFTRELDPPVRPVDLYESASSIVLDDEDNYASDLVYLGNYRQRVGMHLARLEER